MTVDECFPETYCPRWFYIDSRARHRWTRGSEEVIITHVHSCILWTQLWYPCRGVTLLQTACLPGMCTYTMLLHIEQSHRRPSRINIKSIRQVDHAKGGPRGPAEVLASRVKNSKTMSCQTKILCTALCLYHKYVPKEIRYAHCNIQHSSCRIGGGPVWWNSRESYPQPPHLLSSAYAQGWRFARLEYTAEPIMTSWWNQWLHMPVTNGATSMAAAANQM